MKFALQTKVETCGVRDMEMGDFEVESVGSGD